MSRKHHSNIRYTYILLLRPRPRRLHTWMCNPLPQVPRASKQVCMHHPKGLHMTVIPSPFLPCLSWSRKLYCLRNRSHPLALITNIATLFFPHLFKPGPGSGWFILARHFRWTYSVAPCVCWLTHRILPISTIANTHEKARTWLFKRDLRCGGVRSAYFQEIVGKN